MSLGMVIQDNEFETEKNKILTKGKIEPQHMHCGIQNIYNQGRM